MNIYIEDWGKTLESPQIKILFKCPYFIHAGLGFCFAILSKFFSLLHTISKLAIARASLTRVPAFTLDDL